MVKTVRSIQTKTSDVRLGRGKNISFETRYAVEIQISFKKWPPIWLSEVDLTLVGSAGFGGHRSKSHDHHTHCRYEMYARTQPNQPHPDRLH